MTNTNNLIDRELTEAELDCIVGGDTALSHEATHSSNSGSGGGGSLTLTKFIDCASPAFLELEQVVGGSITRKIDASSPTLFQNACSGTPFKG